MTARKNGAATDGDHLKIDLVRKDGDVAIGTVYHTDGTVSSMALVRPGVVDAGTRCRLEQCPGGTNEGVYHVRIGTGHSGPPRANSDRYCKEYDRIFGSKDVSELS
jgi:hypothetical protein